MKPKEQTEPWRKIHTYTEEIHEGDIEKMLLDISVGKGEKRTKIALPDRVVDYLQAEEKETTDLEEEIDRYFYYEYTDNTPNEAIARHFAEWGRKHLK